MSAQTTAPYGSWKSPVTSDLVAAGTVGLPDVLLDGDDLYWVETRPREGGRYVLVRHDPGGGAHDLTPPGFSARTLAHEYGGGAASVSGGVICFTNFTDQRLYRQDPGASPRPLTAEGLRHADGVLDRARRLWVGVREDHTAPGHEPRNSVVAVDLEGRLPARVLAEGNDFYSSPRLSPDGARLAWLTWNHPNLPWVGTELWVADLTAGGEPGNPARVAGGPEDSVFQPEWSPSGELFFVSDRTGWWNLYSHVGGKAEPLCPMEAEFGLPQWVFGLSTYAFAGPDRLVCSYVECGLGQLAVLDLSARRLTPLRLPFTEFGAVRARGGRAVFRAGSAAEPPGVVELDVGTGRVRVLRRATEAVEGPGMKDYLSTPVPVEFPTEEGRTAHGLFYSPRNPDYRGPEGELPPLVVKCHGGPTGAASSALDLRTQFWTSRGVAVLDVNYGGSTGYGRAYRERLYRSWGVVDVQDCLNGVRHLASVGLVDPGRCVITGGSAGGYTALAALTFPDLFRGGASHYGVSDLEALAADTHKFESRYLDWLVGPLPAARDVYAGRSPLHHADRLSAPVIFFQGEEDKVVPPNQTERMVEALRGKGVPVGYLLFAGEQHGFRREENIRRALDAELYFYAELVWKVGLRF